MKTRDGQTIWHRTMKNADGSAMAVRRTGKIQTWKRDANRFRAPCKYGMYDHGAIESNNIDDFTLEEPYAVKLELVEPHGQFGLWKVTVHGTKYPRGRGKTYKAKEGSSAITRALRDARKDGLID